MYKNLILNCFIYIYIIYVPIYIYKVKYMFYISLDLRVPYCSVHEPFLKLVPRVGRPPRIRRPT